MSLAVPQRSNVYRRQMMRRISNEGDDEPGLHSGTTLIYDSRVGGEADLEVLSRSRRYKSQREQLNNSRRHSRASKGVDHQASLHRAIESAGVLTENSSCLTLKAPSPRPGPAPRAMREERCKRHKRCPPAFSLPMSPNDPP
jgi:hypothetical protein